ncbi:MAG: hypothetical protein ACTHKJ_08565 [Candidatus Nitrosocosmicus sp.]
MTHSYYSIDITTNSNNTTTNHKNDLKAYFRPLDFQLSKTFNNCMDILYDSKIIVNLRFYLSPKWELFQCHSNALDGYSYYIDEHKFDNYSKILFVLFTQLGQLVIRQTLPYNFNSPTFILCLFCVICKQISLICAQTCRILSSKIVFDGLSPIMEGIN